MAGSYPGSYSISASAIDNSGQQEFAKIQTFSVIAPYKDGSKPPISRIVYPQEARQESDAPDPDGYPSFKTPAFTSASVIPLVTNGYDQDGSLEKLSFLVDGVELDLLTGYIQILDAPLDGDMFLIDDGLGNSMSFEFDDDNVSNPVSQIIPISPIFFDIVHLQTAIDCDGRR